VKLSLGGFEFVLFHLEFVEEISFQKLQTILLVSLLG
jgi:hypothetical protein